MSELDLTPFGFTPTENAVYRALLERGPSGGYPLSNALGIARANVYQALKGLVGKEAAVLVTVKPAEYRAVRPDALFARIVDHQAGLLQSLENQISATTAPGEPSVVAIESPRAFTRMVLKDAALTEARVAFLGPPALLRELAPVWRKRASEDRDTSLWCVGEQVDLGEVAVDGEVTERDVHEQFGTLVALYRSETAGMAIMIGPAATRGYWTDEPLLRGIIGAALDRAVSGLT